jgi:hypothetical protein
MARRQLELVALATALALVVGGCGRSEDETLDAEREEAAPTADGSLPASASASPVLETSVVVGEAGFPLTMQVPASWDETGVGAWVIGSGPNAELGRRLTARPGEDPAPGSPFRVGARVSTSQVFLERYDIATDSFARFATGWAGLVAKVDYTDSDPSCEYGGVSDVSVGAAYALHRIWTSCGDGTATIADAWSADPDTGEVVYGFIVVEGGDSIAAARAVLGSISREGGEPVLDVDG